MRYLLIIWILFISASLVYSQDTAGLRDIIDNPETDVSRRNQAIIELAKSFQFQNPDSAADVVNRVLESEKTNADSMNIVRAYYVLSQISSTKGNFKKALEYDLALLDMGMRLKDDKIHSDALNNLGEDYYDQGAYSTAYDYYQKSRRKAIEARDSLLIAITTYNVGKVLTVQGQYDRARYYLNKSRTMSNEIDDKEGIVYCDLELAKIDLNSGKIDESLAILGEAEKSIDNLEIYSLKPEIYNLFALGYERKGDLRSALVYYSRLGEYQENVGNLMGVGQSSLGKGRVWMELGNMNRSRSYLDQALAVANLISNKALLRDTYQQLAILHEKSGDLKNSLTYYKEYFQLKDTLSSEQRNEQFANMQLMHETAQKDSEIRIMQERQEQQKARLENEEFKNNILVVILALGAVLLFNLYRGSVKRKKINRVLLAHKREIEEKSREMEGLLSMKDKFLSIISHDLRSPINSLLGTIDMLNKGHLSEEESRGLMTSLKNRLTNTRKLLDNLLDWALVQMDEIHIKLKKLDLHDIVQENIDFFHETNEKHIIFFNKVPRDTYVLADPNMLELILRNLIVNSIKFTQAGGFIEIDVEQNKDDITVCISDNGIGMTNEQAEKLFDTTQLYSTPGTQNEQGTGLGLKLCKEFIERMEGSIWVESEKDEGSTFKFTLKIPQRIDNSLSSTHNQEPDYGYNILE